MVIPAKAKTKCILIHILHVYNFGTLLQANPVHFIQAKVRKDTTNFIYCNYIATVQHFVAIAEYTHVRPPYVISPFSALLHFTSFFVSKGDRSPIMSVDISQDDVFSHSYIARHVNICSTKTTSGHKSRNTRNAAKYIL